MHGISHRRARGGLTKAEVRGGTHKGGKAFIFTMARGLLPLNASRKVWPEGTGRERDDQKTQWQEILPEKRGYKGLEKNTCVLGGGE